MLLSISGNYTKNWTNIMANVSGYNSLPRYVIPVPIIIFILVIVLIVNLVGNSIVFLVIVRKRRMRTFTNCLLLNLAVADLTIALICIPLEIPLELNNFKWIYGKLFCLFFYPLQTATIFASAFTLVGLSCSRYWAIVHPFRKQPNLFAAKVSVSIIWFSSLLLVVPFTMGLGYIKEQESCTEVWDPLERHTYTVAVFITQFILPFTLIIGASSRIAYEMALKKPQSYRDKKREEESKKLMKLLFAISVTFIICCLPLQIVTIRVEFGRGPNFKYLEEIKIAAYVLLYINSALNPIIYNVFSSSFRNGLISLFRGQFCFLGKEVERHAPTTVTLEDHYESIKLCDIDSIAAPKA